MRVLDNVKILLDLSEHYSPVQIESLLEPEVLLGVYASLEGAAGVEALRGQLAAGQKPGMILLDLTLVHGAPKVWAEVPPRKRLSGAEDTPAGTPIKNLEPEPLSKRQIIYLGLWTVSNVVATITVLHYGGYTPIPALLVCGLASVATGVAAYRVPGGLGALVSTVCVVALSAYLGMNGAGINKLSLMIALLPSLLIGALVAIAAHRLMGPPKESPKGF